MSSGLHLSIMLGYYRIGKVLAVGPPGWRRVITRSPVGIVLRSREAFPPSHPTTRMCLQFALQVLAERPLRRVLDVGCGSGILAVAALKLGASWAVGVDICPRALQISEENSVRNKVADRLHLVRGSTEAVRGSFDLLFANLPVNLLQAKLSEMVRLARKDGFLILSGFQDVDKP
ncbi:MAG: 50S ribosomal protein L11 methyltransferase, partial [Deltaproteobacteria bacterium]|nr:50S ribosomal protein L11 methyltransferase [Deltaproteobacteria bacterium]